MIFREIFNKQRSPSSVLLTVIKHDGHQCEHEGNEEKTSHRRVSYVSREFSNVWSVLSQCNTRLKLLHLLYDIDTMR